MPKEIKDSKHFE
jgi:geranylgeranyl pyrophosphate synthase